MPKIKRGGKIIHLPYGPKPGRKGMTGGRKKAS